MPCDMSKYPKNWTQIRDAVLRRAGGRADDPRIGARCEFCGAQNYSVGYRLPSGEFVLERGNQFYDALEYATSYSRAREVAEHLNAWLGMEHRRIVIVLTIAHIHDPNPQNVSMDNLAALCQRCHNKLDMPMRMQNAKRTRREKIINAGQLELIPATL